MSVHARQDRIIQTHHRIRSIYLCYSFRAEDGIIDYKVRLFRMDVMKWCDYAGTLVSLMCVGIEDPLHIYLSPVSR